MQMSVWTPWFFTLTLTVIIPNPFLPIVQSVDPQSAVYQKPRIPDVGGNWKHTA